MTEKRTYKPRTSYICSECGRKFTIINYRFSKMCWRCRQSKERSEQRIDSKYFDDYGGKKTNDELLNEFIKESRETFPEIRHLPNEEQEIILWKAVIESFEKKYGNLEDLALKFGV